MEKITVYYGSEIKLNVSIDPMHGLSMDDYSFDCEFYCMSNKVVKLNKLEMAPVDKNNYIAKLDTKGLGTGTIKCKITAYIPDTYGGNDWLRDEVLIVNTGIYITRR